MFREASLRGCSDEVAYAMQSDPTLLVLMYVVTPVWLAAGFADWLCHRATAIEITTGAKESIIHLLMFAEIGVPLLAALFLEIDALVIAVMIAAFLLHEATAFWDVTYASKARLVTPLEQHVHSFLEMLPLMALLLVVTRHWGQTTALLGFGEEPLRFDLGWKAEPLPAAYVVSVLLLALVFDLVPFVEELVRGLRANGGRLTPEPARRIEDAGKP